MPSYGSGKINVIKLISKKTMENCDDGVMERHDTGQFGEGVDRARETQ